MLPVALCRLVGLKILSVRHNRLADLPSELENLNQLQHADFDGNPLPAAILSAATLVRELGASCDWQGPAALRSFLHDRMLQAGLADGQVRISSLLSLHAEETAYGPCDPCDAGANFCKIARSDGVVAN